MKMPEEKTPEELRKEIARFLKWLAALDAVPAMNFATLVQLPNATELISRMPDGEYRDMAIFGLAMAAVRATHPHTDIALGMILEEEYAAEKTTPQTDGQATPVPEEK